MYFVGSNPGNRVVYSDSTESFGIQPQPPNISYINSSSKPVTNGTAHSKPNKSAQNKENGIIVLKRLLRWFKNYALKLPCLVKKYLV